MDSITQAALGGLCGEITLRKQLGWKGMAWGLFFGTLPDLDIIAYPWLDPMQRLSWHRGLSHSILLCFLAAFIFGWLISRLHRKKGVTRKQATGFVFITWATHIIIDCFTSYGTQIYEPFSSHRVAWNNMSIIDVFFTLPLLLGLLLACFFKKESGKRTGIGRATATWLCLYTSASFILKHRAHSYFERQLDDRGIVPHRMMTSPTISNIFLWRMIAETDNHYHVAYWSFFDEPDRLAHIDHTPKGHDHLKKLGAFPETEQLIWFAKGWHKVLPDPANPGTLLFIDMRFTEMVTPDSKRPVFVWRLEKSHGTPHHITFTQISFRDAASSKNIIHHLRQRILGGELDWMQAPWPWEKTP